MLKSAEFPGGNTLFHKSCMPCDRGKLWVRVEGGGGAVLPYELDRYVLPDKVTMVSIIKQGIILSLLALCSWCDR